MIDTHTHLFDSQFDADRDDTFQRAASVGITHFILPAIDSLSHQSLLNLAAQNPTCLPTIGLHPTSVNDNPNFHDELNIVRDYLYGSEVKFVAVGEIGLDLYWSRDFLNQQIEALVTQVQWAIEKDLPVIIHVRDAWSEIFDALAPYKGKLRGVFHSFSGNYDDFLKSQELGDFYIGIGGPVTYKKLTLPTLLQQVPLDRIVLETDAPYLPPTPHRGTRNEPYYLSLVSARLAEIYDVSIEEIDRQTTKNSCELFKI